MGYSQHQNLQNCGSKAAMIYKKILQRKSIEAIFSFL